MAEIKDLDIILSDIGWDKFGGKSFNVWGTVPFPKELLTHMNKCKNTPVYFYNANTGKKVLKSNKKSSVWTAFDNYIYSQPNDVKEKDLPRISATFKSCFSKYGAVTENIGMQLAMELDMPTSYNYIVKFDPKKHPRIVRNYPTMSKRSEVLPYGIVSIDFLQSVASEPVVGTTTMTNKRGEIIEISSIDNLSGDELLPFDEAMAKYGFGTNKLEGTANLVENWIRVVDEIVKREFPNLPQEKLNKIISQTHSRIARSYLLKDSALGDCDFTAYNGGVVINRKKMSLRYAPNHDFGESFNGLVRDLIKKQNPTANTEMSDDFFDVLKAKLGINKEFFEKLPPATKEKLLEQIGQTRSSKSKTVPEIARMWASSTSEQNFYYILENFPEACEEFFESIDMLVQRKKIDKIINKYTQMTCNGKPLLNKEEAKMFKEYLYERISHICNLYTQFLNKNDREIPQFISLDTTTDSFSH